MSKPKALLCIISPDYLSSHKFFYDIDYTHSFVTTEKRIRMLLNDVGYQSVFNMRLAGGEIGWKSNVIGFIGGLYNNYLYRLLESLLKSKIDPIRLGRTRTVMAPAIFILAQKE